MGKNISKVNVRETKEIKEVNITSDDKPVISSDVIEKWQSIVDFAADIMGVPSGLIMQLQAENIKVFLKSNTDGNPYEIGEEAPLKYGLYCETVIGKQEPLIVPDATKDPVWKDDNPDVDLNMISYMGVPLNWPDGEIFGTVCVLDNKDNPYNEKFKEILLKVKDSLEKDLGILLYQNELREKNVQLEQANETKSKFLSLISHDVRGAVNSTHELLRLILDDYDNFDKETIKRFLISIKDSARSTYITLENLLSWSKNDLVDLKPNFQLLDIAAIMDRLISNFKHSIQLKDIKVTKSYFQDQVTACVDEEMFETALRNIISNAIKYTHPGGSISIRIKEGKEKLRIEIEDNGVGMNEATINRLFSYDNLHKKGTKGEISSGIGLIITKEFLDKHGADVQIESEPGKGTKFIIEI